MSRLTRLFPILALGAILASCSDDNDDPIIDAFDETRYVGSWAGTWNNSTFSSSGTVTANVTINSNNLVMVVDLGGNVFGGGDPASETFTVTFGGTSARLEATNSSTYGVVTGELSANGDFEITGTNVPGGNVTGFQVNGNWGRNTISASVAITLAGSNANATAVLNKQ